MKKAFTLLVLIVTPTMAFAQGTVGFINNTAGLVRRWTSPTDSTLISVPVGGARVELLAAPAGTGISNPLVSYPFGGLNFSTLASFLASNPGWSAIATTEIGPEAGIFDGGNVTLPNVAPGANAEYVIIGWTGSFATFDAAIASSSSFFGSSPVFTTATGNPTTTPPRIPVLLSATFTGMYIYAWGPWVPEFYFRGFTIQPTSQTVVLGGRATFYVAADAYPPPFYQWYFNGVSIPGACSSSFQISNAQLTNAGAYGVMLSNSAWEGCSCGGGVHLSAPAMLSVIPSVERRTVPGLVLRGQPGSVLNLEDADAPAPSTAWETLDSVVLTNTAQWYFDNATPLPSQRFYRARQPGGVSVMPTLDPKMVPALSLTGLVGGTVRVDYINQFGPTDAWVTLDTVTLTNTAQLYFDVSATGQPPRLYRLVQVP